MKKNINIFKTLILCLFFVLVACEDDFLDKYPKDAMSDETFFNNASDYKTYSNGLYNSILRSFSNRWRTWEDGSDNLITTNPNGSLMQHSVSGEAPETNAIWNNNFANIRKVNYMLGNKNKANRDAAVNHYIGEAFFIRSWYYFNLLQEFGGVPYIEKVLETDSPELFKTRDSRDLIASKIIEDLDSAIVLMQWKGEGEAKAPRLNKESALLMKTRVGLFEGSWQYYHGRKNTPFKMNDKNGIEFLSKVIEAGEILISRQGSNIFNGPTGAEYYDLFNRDDYNSISGAFFYKHYDVSSGVWASSRQHFTSYEAGLTKEAVYSYLMIDGKPEDISTIEYDYTNQNSLIKARDPRLNQTIYAPERGPFNETWDFIAFENITGAIYSNLNIQWAGKGGYTIFKGAPYSAVTLDQNNLDDLILRYGEALLNYAEAKAILGNITQDDINKTINVLRNRVSMVPMDMAEVNSWVVDYPEKLGYDPSASNVLNEIRRERRVELMLEGFRTTDIKRWALYEVVFNGYKPKGAFYQEYADYWNNHDNLREAGFPENSFNNFRLEIGQTIDTIGEYINPFWRHADFTPTGRGFYIDPDRDYLQAIPRKEIEFYRERGGVELEQNPGWF
jgi:starch-binding outer membrane protein, SusD/RagB family